MRQITSDNIVHMEKRATNRFGLFLVILAVIAILGGGGFLIYTNKDNIDWELKLPWEIEKETKTEKKKEEAKKKKTQKELLVPTNIEEGSFSEEGCRFAIVNVTADDKGYLFEAEFSTSKEWANINIEAILIDNYYTTTSFGMTNRPSETMNQPTKKEFRINKTELDSMNIYGFKKLSIYFSLETPGKTTEVLREELRFENEIYFDNGREGLIKIAEIGGCTLEYYQTVKANDATYIYFDIHNGDLKNVKNIYIRKLMINGRLYEMPEFEVVAYKGSKSSFYIKIPVEKIDNVEEFLVSFIIVTYNKNDEVQKVHITNEYSNTL